MKKNTVKKDSLKYLAAAVFALVSLTSCGSENSSVGNTPTDTAPAYNEAVCDGASYSDADDACGSYEGGSAYDASDYFKDYNMAPTAGEEYSVFAENGFRSVKANPLSTFSADVDTASYSNIRRMINDYGYVPETDAVRVEEMINYFDYNYSAPENDDPFSVTTELGSCPWNEKAQLLSVGIKGKEIKDEERVPSNIVFLLDVSGSMYSPDKLPLMVNAFSMLSENLTSDDRVSIVTYAGEDAVLLEGAKGSDYRKINRVLSSLEAGGSTNGSAGINTAYELAEKFFIEGGNNRVILATDGDLNVGVSTEEGLKKLVESKRDSGIYLSVLGFGTGNLKDNKMETLADNGNGNYSYIDSMSEAEKVLVKEMSGTLCTIAKDVKFQVEFNPALVSEYRLIGYENRLMKDEDFYDDKKDAGEIGSGHTVTALYEIIPVSSEIPLKYQPAVTEETDEADTYSDELLTVSIKYKNPDEDSSNTLKFPVKSDEYTDFPSENMRFASCVAEFGMLLRRGDNMPETICYDDIINTLEGLDCIHSDQYKAEFTDLVKIVSESV